MGILAVTAVILILSAGSIVGLYVYLTRAAGGGSKDQNEAGLKAIEGANSEIAALLNSKDSFVGPGQFTSIQKKKDDLSADMEKERGALKQIEQKLDGAQKMVEQKETEQQEIKAAKESDTLRLQELLVNYEDISRQSMTLEQKLATSLKNLDSILNELEMTQAQREMFEQLQSVVNESGARMRDLIMEYQTVNERLQMLRQQHSDLEEEYTRLVEQQLGE